LKTRNEAGKAAKDREVAEDAVKPFELPMA
jgi:hypothetical protein